MVWSDLCPSCCGNTGRMLHGICKYAGEQIVAHGSLVLNNVVRDIKHHICALGQYPLSKQYKLRSV